MASPKFHSISHSFYTELKSRVGNYFEEVRKSPTGNYQLYIKAMILVAAFLLVYVHLVVFTPGLGWA